MFKIASAHFRTVARSFRNCFDNIAAGIETNNPELKQTGIRGLKWLVVPRLILWGPGVIYYAVKGGNLLAGYIECIVIFYIIAAVITAMTPAPETPPQEAVASPSDAIVMKHAKQGLNALLDHIFLVCESLAEQTEIDSPRTKGELACPDMQRCISIEDGVAVVTVQLHYVGEIDTAKFLEHFNERMEQKLNSGELMGKPPAVFTDKDNEPHTAIQPIRCFLVKGKNYIRLEVIRVNQAALALMDKVDRENALEAGGEEQLYDDDL